MLFHWFPIPWFFWYPTRFASRMNGAISQFSPFPGLLPSQKKRFSKSLLSQFNFYPTFCLSRENTPYPETDFFPEKYPLFYYYDILSFIVLLLWYLIMFYFIAYIDFYTLKHLIFIQDINKWNNTSTFFLCYFGNIFKLNSSFAVA